MYHMQTPKFLLKRRTNLEKRQPANRLLGKARKNSASEASSDRNKAYRDAHPIVTRLLSARLASPRPHSAS